MTQTRERAWNARDHRQRPLPREKASRRVFRLFLFSLSLSFLKHARPNRGGPFFCIDTKRRPSSSSAFVFSNIRERLLLELSLAFSNFFINDQKREEEEKKTRYKKKKERKKEGRARLEKKRLSLFWWCLAAQKTPIDASAARVSLPSSSSSSSSSSSPFPPLSR